MAEFPEPGHYWVVSTRCPPDERSPEIALWDGRHFTLPGQGFDWPSPAWHPISRKLDPPPRASWVPFRASQGEGGW